MDNIYSNIINNINKKKESALRRIFSSKIKQNFLIEMLHKVKDALGNDWQKYYDMNYTDERIVQGDDTLIEYELCRMIVGLHRSKSIFIGAEKQKREKSDAYKKELVDDVLLHIKLRNYATVFFRNKQLLLGEEFLYFPVPYKLFAICIQANTILTSKSKDDSLICSFYVSIFNKALAALALLEDNFLDNVYPICRALIELFVKLHVLELYPGLEEKYDLFTKYEIEKTCHNGEYPVEFNNLYNNRNNQKKTSKADFIHYGWVDYIKDYHKIVKRNNYSLYGLFDLLEHELNCGDVFQNLKILYTICHPFTHGNSVVPKYPLLSYFEISIMLSIIIPRCFELLCEHTSVEKLIDGIDILAAIKKDITLLSEQYYLKSTENFEKYYKQ